MYFSFYSHFNDCDVTNLTSKNLALISLRLLLKSPGHAYPKSHIQNILWKKCQSRRIFLIKFDWINITIEICSSLEKLTIYRSFCFYYFAKRIKLFLLQTSLWPKNVSWYTTGFTPLLLLLLRSKLNSFCGERRIMSLMTS